MKHRKRGTNGIPPYPPFPASSKSEKDMEEICAKARAAAGYNPYAAELQDEQSNRQPLKKRNRRADFISSERRVRSFKTPAKKKVATPVSGVSKVVSQKWDEMYDCLIEFIENRREMDTKGFSEKEKNAWVWDGNVPTTCKTKDGKALGRWINNQRSAKNKGNLKADREQKLASTGLKWGALATNPWQDMMEELRIYVREKTKDGKAWDGNVPTNYRIKCSNGATGDEDKNLGRWVNRQRSLYRTGKLRQDRRSQLEKIGLNAGDGKNAWDGNVPTNHKTNDNDLGGLFVRHLAGKMASALEGNPHPNYIADRNVAHKEDFSQEVAYGTTWWEALSVESSVSVVEDNL